MNEPKVACLVWVKAHETAWAVIASDYPELLAAWQGGRAFWSGTTVTGHPITLKLADVVCVATTTLEPDDADDAKPPWAG